MELLCIGDFHGSDALRDAAIAEANSGRYDLFLAVGDYEDPDYYTDLVDRVDIPFLALTGNWDFGFEPPDNDEYERLFNYKRVRLDDYHIVLLGAVYPDNFQEEVAAFFEDVPHEKRIIATHYPPHMLGDLTRTGTRAGFDEFRDLLLQTQPAVWVCGHIHEDFGEFELLDTTVLNAAAKETGKGWRVSLGDDGVTAADEVALLDADERP